MRDGFVLTKAVRHTTAAKTLLLPPLMRLLPQVTGLTVLSQLMFLDVSHNAIQHLDASQLPPSLCFLKVWPVQHESGQKKLVADGYEADGYQAFTQLCATPSTPATSAG